ncbi:Tom7-domain-containing protein [Basidiobolus meristosporus CBS 931.73]|uniref:Tom7-domain-containing protein n=1 Tax=Basidiobolus meristosporus CBS 931.73 TaxID=1314790 RepID=A0A1Y1YAX0_9FUNG|nr:Tom7-domain-containing protein [Basidiobolus meristosporus CBS 931.73]|eukprot:ORX95113.1 Tom7-domain-containing protein [Basidiobolus meristosporus CBS 931.73]
MRDETKELILRATDITKRIVHIGFIPFIIYLGFTRSSPKPSLIRMISPLA